MDGWLGAIGYELAGVAVLAGLIVVGLILFGMRSRRRSDPAEAPSQAGRQRGLAPRDAGLDLPRPDPYSTGRLTVLDTVIVDDERRLVLIRRDRVEHLLMIGGPTDVVVESRIADHPEYDAVPAGRDQGAIAQGQPQRAALQAQQQIGRQPAAAPDYDSPDDDEDAGSGFAFPATPATPSRQPAPEREPVRAARTAPPPAPAAEPRREAAPRAAAPARGPQAEQPQSRPTAEQQQPARRRAPVDMPPFDDGEVDIESAPAARVEPLMPLGAAPRPAAPASAADAQRRPGDAGTTLGDLAERLEEALAREVHANQDQNRHLELDLDEFELDLGTVYPEEGDIPAEDEVQVVPASRAADARRDPEPRPGPRPVTERTVADRPASDRQPDRSAAEPRHEPEPRPAAQQKQPQQRPQEARASEPRPIAERMRAEDRVRPVERAVMPAAPEAEARRDPRAQAERQDDPPVINLSSRRRENADPLEDEMARLLGELTGDGARR